jgi:hypothetical protein
MAELVSALMFWVTLFTGAPKPEVLPAVVKLPHAELEQLACGRPCPVLGLYRGGTVIYIDESLDPEHDQWARSVVLHELVHYVQDVSGKFGGETPCDRFNLREREAYAVQNRYLERVGLPRRAGLNVPYCHDNRPPAGEAAAAGPPSTPPR